MDIDLEELHDTDTSQLKAQISRDWKKLKQIQTELQNLQPVQILSADVGDQTFESGASGGPSNPGTLRQLMQEHEKRLKAELQVINECDLKTLPESREIQLLVLHQEQIQHIEQLEETLTFLRAKRTEVMAELKQEEESHSLLQSVNEVLKKKVSASNADAVNENDVAHKVVIDEMETKYKTVDDAQRKFKTMLKEFLNKHFKAPTNIKETAKQKKSDNALNDSRSVDMENVLPLYSIVGVLIEQSINSPAQPYIDLDNRFWPEHVEFLLRCQIAVKDPQNSNRMKLVPFHL